MGTRTMLAICLGAAVALADEVEVKGSVLDADDKPVAGVEVATMWDGGGGAMRAFNGATTDAEGKFVLKAEFDKHPLGLLAFDKARKLGASLVVGAQAIAEGCELKLEPVVTVRGKFTCSDLGAPPSWMNVYAMLQPGNVRVAQCATTRGDFAMVLPVGDFKFHMYGEDVEDHADERFIEGTEGTIDFGAIDLRAARIAKLYGKPPPAWTVTDARGVGKDVSPAKFKGKWLLLEFWGFW